MLRLVCAFGAPCVLAACQPSLGSLVGRDQSGDAGSDSGPGEDAAARAPDAGDAGTPADAGGRTAEGSLADAALQSQASLEGDAAVDAAARAPSDGGTDVTHVVDASSNDAGSTNSLEWPLADASVERYGDSGVVEVTQGVTRGTVDGDISDWPKGIWTELRHRVDFTESTSSGELTAACAWQAYGDDLLLAVVVRDDIHDNEHGGFNIWNGDSVQVAFDVGQARMPYDWEYGVALIDGKVDVHRWLSTDAALGEEFPAAVTRSGGVTVYELRFEPSRLGLASFQDAVVRASVAVNDSDGSGRTGALELVPGIVEPDKSKSEFAVLSW